jgi:thiopeptide-type bacteriocin biosynthesis protein
MREDRELQQLLLLKLGARKGRLQREEGASATAPPLFTWKARTDLFESSKGGDYEVIFETRNAAEKSAESGDVVSSNSRPLFSPVDFFMLRAPLLSLEHYLEAFSRPDEEHSGEDTYTHRLPELGAEVFEEAIAVASPSLHAALRRLGDEVKPRKARQRALTASRYFARMTTRATPFGLFSGVAVGSFGESTNVSLAEARAHPKRTRPDMRWMMRIVQRLEGRMDIVRQLRVVANPAVLVCGERAVLPYFTQYGLSSEGERTETVSLRYTPPVRDALHLAGPGIGFGELEILMQEQYPGAGAERIASLLEQLFRQEFLLGSLRPSLSETDPLGHVISELFSVAGVEEELAALVRVREAMHAYDRLPIGAGLEAYQSLKTGMKEIAEEDPPVQIDAGLVSSSGEPFRLHRKVGEEMARVGELLWRLSTNRRGVGHLRSYHREFLERYGADREVPVLELLDEESGLGPPATYTAPKGPRDPAKDVLQKQDRENSLLTQLAVGALMRGEDEIELTEELVSALAQDDADESSAPVSLELYAQVVAESARAVDEGDFRTVLCPNPGSHAAGMSFGRFLDVMEPDIRGKLRQVHKQVTALRPEAEFVDLVYQPRAGRSANVSLAPSWRDYGVIVGTNPAKGKTQALALGDLWVGATLDRFYVRSTSLGKEVVIAPNNMLNPQGAPNMCRFLYELAHEGVRLWEPFSWEEMSEAPKLPRVRYSKTILSPAQWKVDRRLLGSGVDLDDDGDWENAFERWRGEWSVPRYVFMVSNDQRVLLDLENPLHVTDLRREVGSKDRVVLHEMLGGFTNRWAEGPDGAHVTECVFPLVRTRASHPSPAPFKEVPRRLPPRDLVRLPGGEWLFAKLYVPRHRQNDFIAGGLSMFSERMVEEGNAGEWFYIRYADPEPHLRLRFRGEPGILASRLLPALHSWAEDLHTRGALKDLSIHAYEREVERYGGPEAMREAEALFAADSRTTAALLRLLAGGQTDLEPAELAAVSIVHILEGLGWGPERRLAWLTTASDKHQYREEFRECREKLMDLMVDDGGSWDRLGSFPGGQEVLDAWSLREAELRAYGEKLRALEEEGRLWNSPERVAGSVVHMHCNRLMGVEREPENKALVFARNAVFSSRQRAEATR